MSTRNFTSFDKEIAIVSNLFDLLSDKNRLSVFAILTYGESTVSAIYKCLHLRQNLISHHLKVLREKGLVKSRKQGREVYYSLNPAMLKGFAHVIHKITRPLEKNAYFHIGV